MDLQYGHMSELFWDSYHIYQEERQNVRVKKKAEKRSGELKYIMCICYLKVTQLCHEITFFCGSQVFQFEAFHFFKQLRPSKR